MTNRRRLTLVSVVVSLAALCVMAAPARAWYQYGTASYSYAYAPTFQAAVSDCDDCITTVTLPFAFPYYGRSFTTVTISSNGVMRLGSYSDGASMFSNPQLGYDGNGSYNYPLIAPLWDDWDTLKGGSIYAGRSGTSGPFVVEWYGVQHHTQTTGAGYTFEAKLFPDGGIEFHYMSVDNGQSFDRGATATVATRRAAPRWASATATTRPRCGARARCAGTTPARSASTPRCRTACARPRCRAAAST